MTYKNQDLGQSNYDPNKDLQKEVKGRKSLEPKHQGDPLNENNNLNVNMETNLFKIYDFGDENHTKGAHVFLTKLEVITLDGSNTGSVYDKDNNKIILTKRINQDRIVLSEQCGILPPVEIGLFVFDEKESTQSQYIYKKK